MAQKQQIPDWVEKAVRESKKNPQQLFHEGHVMLIFVVLLGITLFIFGGT